MENLPNSSPEITPSPSLPPEAKKQVEKSFLKRHFILLSVCLAGIIATAIFAFALVWILVPRTEQKGTLTQADTEQTKQEAKSVPVLCGTPPEELDTRNMTLSQFTPMVVNEWYVDPTNPAESFVELRNTSPNPLNTGGVELFMYQANQSDPNGHNNFGVLPAVEVGAGCIITLHSSDLLPKQYAINDTRTFSTEIIPTTLIVGTSSGNDSGGAVTYFKDMPAGYSVSLTPAGKYVSAPKTLGQYNNAQVKPAFQPSVEAISYFKEVVPYIPKDQPNERVVAKWDWQKPTIVVRGNSSASDKACMQQVAQDLRPLTGLELPIEEQPLNGATSSRSINVFYVPADKFPEEAGQNHQAVALPSWHGGDGVNHIDMSEVYINTSLTDSEKCQLLYWGLGKSLGVMRYGKTHADSMFYEKLAPKAGYTQLDKDIIHMLYDRLVEAGDTSVDINRLYP